MKRRRFLRWLGLGGLAAIATGATHYWPREGVFNPCISEDMPESLKNHDLVQAAWEGIPQADFWDCHVHLVGLAANSTEVRFDPEMNSPRHPIKLAQMQFYENAACVESDDEAANEKYIDRLILLNRGVSPSSKLMLLAFDYHHDLEGLPVVEGSTLYVSNNYARRVADSRPDQFEWIASIHPYREDALEVLETSARSGARAVKWLPPAMAIDPSSPRCDDFYQSLIEYDIPLLVHADVERAVHGAKLQDYGNPLLLRRPLDHGVRVIIAHCGSLGMGKDIDKGKAGRKIPNFDLFARLMDEQRYEGLVLGDISAMTQINRIGRPFETIIERDDWHHRLVNGTDYPLPGVMLLFSIQAMVDQGYIKKSEAKVLADIRRYNPLLFDFVCKRSIRYQGKRLPPKVFATRRHFVGQ